MPTSQTSRRSWRGPGGGSDRRPDVTDHSRWERVIRHTHRARADPRAAGRALAVAGVPGAGPPASFRLPRVEGFLARRGLLLTGGILAVIALALVVPAFVLGAAPVVILVLALAAGWFPGEDVIASVRERRARRRRTGAPAPLIARPRAMWRASRLLICFSLANRPPPGLLHA
jgi:hypothetical protein